MLVILPVMIYLTLLKVTGNDLLSAGLTMFIFFLTLLNMLVEIIIGV